MYAIEWCLILYVFGCLIPPIFPLALVIIIAILLANFGIVGILVPALIIALIVWLCK